MITHRSGVGLEPTAHRLCPAVFTVVSEKKPNAKRAETSQHAREVCAKQRQPLLQRPRSQSYHNRVLNSLATYITHTKMKYHKRYFAGTFVSAKPIK